ncbi:CPBP family intramembrane glutamic endopeptidase [Corynebacterium falsenii]|uniref:CPBP family intramembrane glutamic endopeptidase n=1 Tax=Corynebacterium falsenii TaxID=108486 RepID=UPI003FD35A86
MSEKYRAIVTALPCAGYSATFVVAVAFLVVQGLWEELVFRAYLLPRLDRVSNSAFATILTAGLATLAY